MTTAMCPAEEAELCRRVIPLINKLQDREHYNKIFRDFLNENRDYGCILFRSQIGASCRGFALSSRDFLTNTYDFETMCSKIIASEGNDVQVGCYH